MTILLIIKRNLVYNWVEEHNNDFNLLQTSYIMASKLNLFKVQAHILTWHIIHFNKEPHLSGRDYI